MSCFLFFVLDGERREREKIAWLMGGAIDRSVDGSVNEVTTRGKNSRKEVERHATTMRREIMKIKTNFREAWLVGAWP